MNPSAFPSTRWTLIRSAGSSPEARRKALSELMRVYWRPLYVYLRARGLDPAAAQDVVQDVLLVVMERDVIDKVSPEKGRLRAYLKTIASNVLLNRLEAAAAKKRGGDAQLVPLDVESAERLVHPGASPDAAFDQQWAVAVMDGALQALEAEYRSGARKGPWEVVKLAFSPEAPVSYRELASAHQMTLPQLKSFLHRARERYRELLLEQVADTLDGGEDPDRELTALLQAVSG